LSPEAIRIDRLAAQTAAGSPKARFELENDPLGLAARAAKPVWKTIAISETFNLTSTDATAMIVPVVTNQADLSAEACRATMRDVRRFIKMKMNLARGTQRLDLRGGPYSLRISSRACGAISPQPRSSRSSA
jgi:hypothetical protein